MISHYDYIALGLITFHKIYKPYKVTFLTPTPPLSHTLPLHTHTCIHIYIHTFFLSLTHSLSISLALALAICFCWLLIEQTTCCNLIQTTTVHPKKYAHGICFAVFCCGDTLTDFPISIRLTWLALWQSNDCPSASKATHMNMDKYFMWIHYERLHNHNKAKHNKTVCIFLGIYCNYILHSKDQEVETLECNFNDTRICGWSSRYVKDNIVEASDRMITHWTRSKIGIGGQFILYHNKEKSNDPSHVCNNPSTFFQTITLEQLILWQSYILFLSGQNQIQI